MASASGTEITAAVVRKKGGPFNIEKLTLEEPRRDEVLVRIVATGMCHTDMVARDKVYDVPHPIVLGHEGAGIVEKVGADVRAISAGDHVVLTYQPCTRCKAWRRSAGSFDCGSSRPSVPSWCVAGGFDFADASFASA